MIRQELTDGSCSVAQWVDLQASNQKVANQSWSLGKNLRDQDKTLTLRDRDFEQKVETRPRLEHAETRYETFKSNQISIHSYF